jgi:hypothetical protein
MRFVRSLTARAVGRTAAVLALAAAVVGPELASGADTARLDPALCAPGRTTFTLAIDNAYFPHPVGRQWVYGGRDEGERLGVEIRVLGATASFYRGAQRVRARVVQKREWLDANGNGRLDSGEELKEVARSYFAQSRAGHVCHFGEQVDVYEDGKIASHEGSWRADRKGNAPGIYMPAKPTVGMSFQLEIAPRVGIDVATVVASGVRTTVPAGTFTNTIRVRDRNPLDGTSGNKIYARGVGLVLDGPLKLLRY